jgi:hypothetical protein
LRRHEQALEEKCASIGYSRLAKGAWAQGSRADGEPGKRRGCGCQGEHLPGSYGVNILISKPLDTEAASGKDEN